MLMTFLMRMVQGEGLCVFCNVTATSGHRIQYSVRHGDVVLLQSGHVILRNFYDAANLL